MQSIFRNKNINLLFIFVISLSLLMLSPASALAGKSSVTKGEINKNPQDLSQGRASKERAKIIEEAVTALVKTNMALRHLDAKKTDAAIEDLAIAVGKLELVTTRNPELALAPVDVQVITHEFQGTIKDIKKAVKEAKELLKENRVQDARRILKDLGSEVIVRVVNIPLSTYPDGIKAVVPLIDQGKIEKAKAALQELLSTLVVVDHVIPLPIIKADLILKDASEIAKKKNRSTEEEKKLSKLIKQAKNQLEIAEALGYGSSETFKSFYQTISKIEAKTKGGGTEEGLFKSLRKRLKEFWSSFGEKGVKHSS